MISLLNLFSPPSNGYKTGLKRGTLFYLNEEEEEDD